MHRHRLWRYTAAGGVATATHYLLTFVLIDLLACAPGLAAFAGAGLGAVVAYRLHHAWTFAGHGVLQVRALPRFMLVAAVSILINGALVWGLTAAFGTHWLLAQATATLVVLLTAYAANQRWTFQRRR
jgi:putative flippase GtrA